MVQKKLGDQHVLDVANALKARLNFETPYQISRVRVTVDKILNDFKNIKDVKTKFDYKSDHKNDLYLILEDKRVIPLNLFLISGNRAVQQKNLGAKSFLKKYFLSDALQERFNYQIEPYYEQYLKSVAEILDISSDQQISELKKTITAKTKGKKEFADSLSVTRTTLLYQLRNIAFELLRHSYNRRDDGMIHAFKTLMMADEVNLITRYYANKPPVAETFTASIPDFGSIRVYKKGNDTIGVSFGAQAMTLRFKFESDPASSLKLAVSYENTPSKLKRSSLNTETLRLVEDILKKHSYVNNSNASNAIGKCHEALTYYYLLKAFPDLVQVDMKACTEQLTTYQPLVKPETLNQLYKATATVIEPLKSALDNKYDDYKIETIELVPDAYVSNKLDTADIQLNLFIDGKTIVEPLSLKAAAKSNVKLTTKNPGAGTILGPTYFNIGDLSPVVNEAKEDYQIGKIDRTESLTLVSRFLGTALRKSDQESLKRGLKNIMSTSLLVATFYEKEYTICKEPTEVKGNIIVKECDPSPIQTTLYWDDERDSLSLRVKFSKGEKHGWSSIKLACEYQLKI
ncbi:hypothetical protein JMA_35350 [Jeotgalibacillus malaysiensis]|uniref:Uncharacterized protein n=1 Tax=Jeotgalibacillus malaysiensis TaxID=1508404 RepID=A0A0B5AVY9_9BACL|nr:hypothetical protein [Jeotgalibacillus malaysiensis]AJD92852.1 hypothetical protein JMA_35350 [Jeotgalibacillus malaysiensis]